MTRRNLALLTISCLLGSASVIADNSDPYEIDPYEMSQGQFDPQYEQEIRLSGEEAYNEALKFMNRAQSGQLTPQERQMFQSVQKQTDEMMNRIQSGKLTQQEQHMFEMMKKQMRNSISY